MTKDNPNVRELALYVLTEVTDRGEYSNHVLKMCWKNTSIWRKETGHS